jgi:hypothetical protein
MLAFWAAINCSAVIMVISFEVVKKTDFGLLGWFVAPQHGLKYRVYPRQFKSFLLRCNNLDWIA